MDKLTPSVEANDTALAWHFAICIMTMWIGMVLAFYGGC